MEAIEKINETKLSLGKKISKMDQAVAKLKNMKRKMT